MSIPSVESWEAEALAAFAIERASLAARGINLPDTPETRAVWKLAFCAGAQAAWRAVSDIHKEHPDP